MDDNDHVDREWSNGETVQHQPTYLPFTILCYIHTILPTYLPAYLVSITC